MDTITALVSSMLNPDRSLAVASFRRPPRQRERGRPWRCRCRCRCPCRCRCHCHRHRDAVAAAAAPPQRCPQSSSCTSTSSSTASTARADEQFGANKLERHHVVDEGVGVAAFGSRAAGGLVRLISNEEVDEDVADLRPAAGTSMHPARPRRSCRALHAGVVAYGREDGAASPEVRYHHGEVAPLLLLSAAEVIRHGLVVHVAVLAFVVPRHPAPPRRAHVVALAPLHRLRVALLHTATTRTDEVDVVPLSKVQTPMDRWLQEMARAVAFLARMAAAVQG